MFLLDGDSIIREFEASTVLHIYMSSLAARDALQRIGKGRWLALNIRDCYAMPS
jgi:uncharacterized protein with PIN domain